MIPENGLNSAPAGQQPVKISVGNEVVVNGENGYSEGNGKLISNHEEKNDLQEW